MNRNEKCFCGSGIKYKKCHYRISGESKLADLYRAYSSFDDDCKEKGITNTCPSNCSRCCSDFFFISENEFLLILEEIIHRGEDITLYKEKADKVKQVLLDSYPSVISQLEESMENGGAELLQTRYFIEYERADNVVSCIFLNNNNKCSIYSVRPSICRQYGSTVACQFLKNKEWNIDSEKKLVEGIILKKGPTDNAILKRPYPLFYWFSTFLDEKHISHTLSKMEKFATLKKESYYDYTLAITSNRF